MKKFLFIFAVASLLLVMSGGGARLYADDSDILDVVPAILANRPVDKQAVRAVFAKLKTTLETHDLSGFLALFDPNYLQTGENLAAFSAQVTPDFNQIQSFDYAINAIKLSGNAAVVNVTCTLNITGQATQTWSEPSNDSPGFGWLQKTGNGWLIYGNQARTQAHLQTGSAKSQQHGNVSSWLRLYVDMNVPQIKSVSVSGPYIPTTILQWDSYTGSADGEFAQMATLSQVPPLGTQYSFNIQFTDGSTQVLYDTVKCWISVYPLVTVTPGAGTAAIQWSDLSQSVPNADHYWVAVWDANFSWSSPNLPLTQTSIAFNADGTANWTLQSGKNYTAQVTIVNQSGDCASTDFSFTMP